MLRSPLNDDRSQASRSTRIWTGLAVAIGALVLLGALAYLLPALGAPIGPTGVP